MTSTHIAGLLAVVIASLVGFALTHAPLRPYWQSVTGMIGGWLIGSLALAAAWVVWPPPEVEIRAVSIGSTEAAASVLLVVTGGSLLHFVLSMAARAARPQLLRYRPVLMGLIGALIAIAAFEGGCGGIHPAA